MPNIEPGESVITFFGGSDYLSLSFGHQAKRGSSRNSQCFKCCRVLAFTLIRSLCSYAYVSVASINGVSAGLEFEELDHRWAVNPRTREALKSHPWRAKRALDEYTRKGSR